MTSATKTDYPTISAVSDAEIELAMKRAAHLRSKAFTSFFSRLYHSAVGRRTGRDLLLTKYDQACTSA